MAALRYHRCMLNLLALLLAALAAVGCNGISRAEKEARVVADADNGSTIKLAVGEVLRLELASNPTTGFNWELKEFDAEQLKPLDSGYETDKTDTQLAGSGGKQWWRFEALQPGVGGLHLVYRRSFEKDVPPAQSFEVVVKVSGEAAPEEPAAGGDDRPNPHAMGG